MEAKRKKRTKSSSPIKIFIIVFILSLPFFWGINLLEKNLSDFFFWYKISQNPQIFTAQIALEEKLQEMKPIRNREIPDLEIEAKSTISVLVNGKDKEKVLFEKESNQKLPIASLTKLMTVWVVLEHYDLSKEITISKLAANQYGDIRKLEEGKTFPAEYFLYPLLMESSNGAAFALANDYEGMTERNFVELMNREAEKIGLNDTFFDNPTGLDPQESKTEMNYSTANDLVKFTKKLLEKPLISRAEQGERRNFVSSLWEILSLPRYSLYGPEVINTNRFLLKEDKSSSLAFTEVQALDGSTDWQDRTIGGKTGYTGEAGGCLLLVIKAPKAQGFLINIILGANGKENRFEEMKKLVDWLKIAYKW
ncbi:MAG: serine hydrolase [bacterium]|nr:serine hydrolase [bacterium]